METDSLEVPTIGPVPEDQARWLATRRVQRLVERGWRGTALEHSVMSERLGKDPIELGIVDPTEGDQAEARRVQALAESALSR